MATFEKEYKEYFSKGGYFSENSYGKIYSNSNSSNSSSCPRCEIGHLPTPEELSHYADLDQ